MDLEEWLGDSDALAALDSAYAAAWKATDERLLGLCRDRVAMLLGHSPRLEEMSAEALQSLRAWTTSDVFTPLDRAALDFTEQYVIDVSSMTDAQAEKLRAHVGDEGLASFVNALLVIEQRMTLELSLDSVLR